MVVFQPFGELLENINIQLYPLIFWCRVMLNPPRPPICQSDSNVQPELRKPVSKDIWELFFFIFRGSMSYCTEHLDWLVSIVTYHSGVVL